jgi:hypothetical protein
MKLLDIYQEFLLINMLRALADASVSGNKVAHVVNGRFRRGSERSGNKLHLRELQIRKSLAEKAGR